MFLRASIWVIFLIWYSLAEQISDSINPNDPNEMLYGILKVLENIEQTNEKLVSLSISAKEHTPTKEAPVTEIPMDDKKKPLDCHQLSLMNQNTTSVQTIYPFGDSEKPLKVLCEQETDGGGWTVFQQRRYPSYLSDRIDFDRPWTEYAAGFGNVSENGEFWLGLDNIGAILQHKDCELRVELKQSFGDIHYFALYRIFKVGDSSSDYPLTIGDYSGDAGDSLTIDAGNKFTTKDTRDNDEWVAENCDMPMKGGWWYGGCSHSSLNGNPLLENSSGNYFTGLIWYEVIDTVYIPLKDSRMMIRPKYT